MGQKIDKFQDKAAWHKYVGKRICKHSGRPFKSGKKIETVVKLGVNEHSGKFGFVLADESIVDCHQCKLANMN